MYSESSRAQRIGRAAEQAWPPSAPRSVALIAIVVALGGHACSWRTGASEREAPLETEDPLQDAPPEDDVVAAPPEPHTEEVTAPGADLADRARPLGHPEIDFEHACEPGARLTIAAVGDVLLHSRLQRQAVKDPRRFVSLWEPVSDLLRQADLAYANLEGPTAPGVIEGGYLAEDPGFRFDEHVYTTYPRFNYHPHLIDDLVETGVDVVSVANNHILDRGSVGLDRTLDELDAAELAYTGARGSTWRRDPERARWHTVTTVGSWRVAWIACTFSTNGLPDRKEQVLFCYEDREELLESVRELAADETNDAVIVTPHWGWEYRNHHRRKQENLGRELAEAGATAVIGAHPHVIQPWEKWETQDGREVLIVYSLGNFVSNMAEVPERSSLLVYLGLTKLPSGQVVINGARHVPLWLYRDRGERFVADIARQGDADEGMAHIGQLMGAFNEYDPRDVLNTTPQCDPGWRPGAGHYLVNGGIGGACSGDTECGSTPGVACELFAPGGLCSMRCEGRCPRERGRPASFCAEVSKEVGGVCLSGCESVHDCRPGYTCARRPIAGRRRGRARVCVPALDFWGAAP